MLGTGLGTVVRTALETVPARVSVDAAAATAVRGTTLQGSQFRPKGFHLVSVGNGGVEAMVAAVVVVRERQERRARKGWGRGGWRGGCIMTHTVQHVW